MSGRPYRFDLDLLLNKLQNAVIDPVASDPTGGDLKEGRFWYNTTDKQLKYYDGTEVVTLATGGNLSEAVTRATAATNPGELLVSGGADRTIATFDGKGTEGLIKVGADGVAFLADAGTDYLTEDSTNSLTNKTFDANDVGNSISNIEVEDFDPTALARSIGAGTASQLATADIIKQYVDDSISSVQSAIASIGDLVGAFDASSGNLPTAGNGTAGAILSGDFWRVTVAGDIVGLGHLEVGDALVAADDGANTAAQYFVLQANITDAVTSDGNASTDMAIARFEGTSGRMIKNSGATIDETGNINIPAGAEFQIDGVNVLDGIDESYVQVDGSGNINLPAGAQYQIDGANALAGMAKKFAASFNDSTDWVGAEAPFTFTVAAATHGLGATQDIVLSIKDSTGQTVEVGEVIDASGNVVLSSNSKFAGRAVLIG